jgi:hypothetical protein
MKIEDVKQQVERIVTESKVDPETAHESEDKLYEEFVRYCAEGHNQFHIAKLAKEILKTKSSVFARWGA